MIEELSGLVLKCAYTVEGSTHRRSSSSSRKLAW